MRKNIEQFSTWTTSAELPFRLAILMAASIFVVEAVEVGFMHRILLKRGLVTEILVESLFLVVLLSPMLFYFLFRPLKKSEEQLRYLSSRLLVAQESERRRISTELHDELGQALMLMKLQLRSIERGVREGQEEVREECRHILMHIDRVIEDVRRLSKDLSPAVLEDLGLTSALRWLINNFKTNYPVEVISDIMNIDHLFFGETAIVLYRILQEALTNIGKYAEANIVSISIRANGRWLLFCVKDDGKGFDVAQTLLKKGAERGLGLRIMEERTWMLGGFLDIRSQEGKGAQITVTIPLKKEQPL